MRRQNRAGAGYRAGARRDRSRRLRYESLEDRRLLTAAGDLDTTFHFDGKVNTNVQGAARDDFGQAMAIQADGKIVLVGNAFTGSTYDLAITRYNWDGTLDTTFDTDGIVITDLGFTNDFAYAVAIQADGKIVVGGSSNLGVNFDFAVVRYDANGSLDTTFDGDGRVTSVFGAGSHEVRGIAIQSDGKIVVAGYSNIGGTRDFALARFNTNGSLDTSFDGDGRVTTTVGSGSDEIFGVVIQSNGRIVVAGQAHNGSNFDIALARYNTNGSLDTSFDGDGKVVTTIGSGDDRARAILLQSDGKIVVAGSTINAAAFDFAVVRYNTNGSLDTTFDGDGKVITAIGTTDDVANAIAIRADGKLIVAGTSFNGSNDDFALARYNTNGSLDTSFSGDGKLSTAVGTAADAAQAVAFQPDGRIVAAGYVRNGTHYDFGLVRYWSELNGDLDDDWDVDEADIDHMWNKLRNGIDDPGADDNEDFDRSGMVNEDDLDYLLANLIYTTTFGKVTALYGDADLDGGVGGLDYTAWRLRAGTGWAHGDFDGDGGVGGLDYTLWRTRPTAYPDLVGSHGSASSESVQSGAEASQTVSGEGSAEAAASAAAALGSAPASPTSVTQPSSTKTTAFSSTASSERGATSLPGSRNVVSTTRPAVMRRIEYAVDAALTTSSMYRSRHLARGDAVPAAEAVEKLFAAGQ